MSEPAVFAGEFAEADGNKRCSGHRKFFISSLELVFICSLNDKQEFTELLELVSDHNLLRAVLQ